MTLTHGKNRRLIALASVMLATGAALLVWGILSLRSPRSSLSPEGSGSSQPLDTQHQALSTISTSAFAQPKNWPCPIPGDFKPVDIPVGLLCDYYEHGIEHAPPRDPSGVMQKRERFYAAPHDPFELLESATTASPRGAAFASALNTFHSIWQAGKPTDHKELQSLNELASTPSLKSDVLIEAGRVMDWLAGDEAATAFFQAGLAKVRSEYASVSPGDPAALPLLHAIDQTKALWRTKAWPVLEKRFHLANALNARFSVEQRRAHYLVADMLYSECRYDEAAQEVTEVAAEDDRAHDLGVLESSDVPEMEWTQGLFLMADGRLEEAIPLFDECARRGGPHQLDSRRLAVLAMVRAGRVDDALRRIKKLPLPAPRDALTQSIRLEVMARMERRSGKGMR